MMYKVESQLAHYRELILEMGNKVLEIHKLALECAINSDLEGSLKVLKLDEFINNYELEINDRALDVLALLAPVAKDLRSVISGIKIANDLERIGDYAKNVAQYVIKNGMVEEDIIPFIKDAHAIFQTMLIDTMEAYEKKDHKLAFSIPEMDEELDNVVREYGTYIENKIVESGIVSHVVRTSTLMKCYERAGDHLKNINEHTIYEFKGTHYDFG